MNDKLLTVNEVAARLRVTRYTVNSAIEAYRKGDAGGLPAINVSLGDSQKRWRISESALEQWLQRRAEVAA